MQAAAAVLEVAMSGFLRGFIFLSCVGVLKI